MTQCSYIFWGSSSKQCEEPALDGDKSLCIFHDKEAWKTHADEIRNKVNKKLEQGDYHFEGYHFPEIELFHERIFEKLVNFNKATFLEDVDFVGAQFTKGVGFVCAQFSKRAYFTDAQLSELADFSGAIFSDRAFFAGARLEEADFANTQFTKGAYFWGAKFSGNASFLGTESSIMDFGLAVFNGQADFDVSYGYNTLFWEGNFDSRGDNTRFWQGDFNKAVFEKKASFSDAYLDASFVSATLNDSNLRDTRWPKNNILYDERNADTLKNGLDKIEKYRNAVRTYFFIKTRLRAEGDYKNESDFFYRERRAEMKLLKARLMFKSNNSEDEEKANDYCDQKGKKTCLFDWFFLSLAWLICGFGEKVMYILGTFIFTWISFAIIFFFSVRPSHQTVLLAFIDCLYISIGALSGLGYEQKALSFEISESGHWLIQTEALIGIALISLFLVVFVRKMSRQ